MSTNRVLVSDTGWAELSSAGAGCIENPASKVLIVLFASTQPAASVDWGHSIKQGQEKGFSLDTDSGKKAYGRFLKNMGDAHVIVTDY